MTLLAFVLALAILVTVHEWGHYRVAVALGVRVECFSIGFGSPIWRWRRHVHGQDIDFVLGYIPLGGYVRMLDEPQPGMPAELANRAMSVQPLWKRSLIVLAGPLANFVLAVALNATVAWLGTQETQAVLSMPVAGSPAQQAGLKSGDLVVAAGHSQQDMRPIESYEDFRWWGLSQDFESTTTLLEVRAPGLDHTHLVEIAAGAKGQGIEALGIVGARSEPVIQQVLDASPAQAAGLQAGDRVLSVNGIVFDDAFALRQFIRQSGASQTPAAQVWLIARSGQPPLSLIVTPERVTQSQHTIGRVGAQIGSPPPTLEVRATGLDGLVKGWQRSFETSRMTVQMMGLMLTGRASADNLSGPIGMAEFAGQAAQLGLSAYLSYLALISLSLFVLNLLPLPMLDGGHLMYYLLEFVRGRALSASTMSVLQRVGLTLIVGLSVFTFFNDLARLGWLRLF